MRRLLVFAVLLFALPAHAVDIDWVLVGNAGNAADTDTNCLAANCGSVSYDYLISKYEITNAQYAEFLNAKAASDPLNLYEMQMGSDAIFGGIEWSYPGLVDSFRSVVRCSEGRSPDGEAQEVRA
jgi:hypothetical protein